MTLPVVRRRSCHSQAATISPPNRSPRPPRNHDGGVGTSHRFWLADLKANEAALAVEPPRAGVFYSPSPSSTSSADRQQARVASPSADLHYRAAELASITERFREPAAVPSAARRSPTPADLVAMSRLSRDIVNSLAEVARHHRRQDGRGSTITAPSRSDLEKLGGLSGFRKRKANSALCQECGTAVSPQWRRGPDGADTLCNVCGLLYARRMRRQKLAWQRGPSPDLVR
ncbi:GATA zinc finger domain-containing protein 14 like [Verticillium longisporum]|uniref:GATA zinc finger domain-containing protein 14 like n=1 Tax=Verticillium longisporum TaxID=100787 RepID=A0A8I2ZX96_VERLO|nr:GATA zinc finger domain-containing protein 14 like [Verticillium longisporum]